MKGKKGLIQLVPLLIYILIALAALTAVLAVGQFAGERSEAPGVPKYRITCDVAMKNPALLKSRIDEADCTKSSRTCSSFFSIGKISLGIWGDLGADDLYLIFKAGDAESRLPVFGTFKLQESESIIKQINVCTSEETGMLTLLDGNNQIQDTMEVEI